jgi:acetyl esterase/lipase
VAILRLACAVFLVAGLAWGQPPVGAAPAPARAQPAAASFTEGQVLPLWERGAPGALGTDDADVPTMAVYRAQRPNGTAILVFPGGGYGALASVHEGRQWAYWYNAMGITAFVVKYRLGPRYRHPIELGDAQRAIRTVRARAAEFGVSPERVGIMGFSAGGHLVSTAATHFDAGLPDAQDAIDRAGSRPDFLILGYPVISFDPAITHAGSVRNLLGERPDPKLIENLSNDLQVTSRTPPTFLFHTANDTAVPVENSVRFFLALRKAGVPAELHVFENGPHGVGMALSDPSLAKWSDLLAGWLRAHGLTTSATTR